MLSLNKLSIYNFISFKHVKFADVYFKHVQHSQNSRYSNKSGLTHSVVELPHLPDGRRGDDHLHLAEAVSIGLLHLPLEALVPLLLRRLLRQNHLRKKVNFTHSSCLMYTKVCTEYFRNAFRG